MTLIERSLPEFFQEQVSLAIVHQKAQVSVDAEFYLVSLLTSFTDTERLFTQNEQGERMDKALAIQLLEAVQAMPAQKFSMLKNLGDLALYVSGFFSESLIRKLVGRDYYQKMGHLAYASLSGMAAGDRFLNLKPLFDEMAAKFQTLVNVVSEVAEATQLNNDQNLLRLYEKWLTTGSETTRRLLHQRGFHTAQHKTDNNH